MGLRKAIKTYKYSKDYLKIKISIIQVLYLYLERKKNVTILNFNNHISSM